MNQFFALCALFLMCAAVPLGCSAQTETADAAIAATSPANAPLTIVTPASGADVARNTLVKGTAKAGGAGVKVKVEIQPASGEWFDMGTVNLAPDGKWSVTGYFGADDTPVGSKFKVRAQLLNAQGKIVTTQISDDLKKAAEGAAPQTMPDNASQTTEKPIVMGYYPSYRAELTAAELRDDRFTDIIYSFAKADANGVLDAASYAAFPAFVKTAHAKNLKAILGLSGGGNGENFAVMVRDSAKRARFVAAIGDLIQSTRADGVALDWEQPEASDKPLTTQLARELRAATKAANPAAKMILVVNASAYNSQGYDGPVLRDSFDYLHIMSYDFHGPWNHAGHHANLFETGADKEDGERFSYPKALDYWRDVQKFPTGKILMGLAGYGRGFRAPDWGVKETGKSDYPEISYADISALVGQGWTRQWDAQAHAPWLLSADKSDRISYDDAQSVADKAAWMKAQGLAGFFIWELKQEEVGGDNVLTAAALQSWQKAASSE